MIVSLQRASERRDRASLRRRVARSLLLLLSLCSIATGCGSYASQAGKHLTAARSEVLACAYTLERFADGETSGPFVRASLEQYATAMKSTVRSISSLKPPPGAGNDHRRQVEAISQAQDLVQGVGQRGIAPERAPELAQKLRGIAQELRL